MTFARRWYSLDSAREIKHIGELSGSRGILSFTHCDDRDSKYTLLSRMVIGYISFDEMLVNVSIYEPMSHSQDMMDSSTVPQLALKAVSTRHYVLFISHL